MRDGLAVAKSICVIMAAGQDLINGSMICQLPIAVSEKSLKNVAEGFIRAVFELERNQKRFIVGDSSRAIGTSSACGKC